MIITVTIKNDIVRDAIGGAGCDYWCDLRDKRHKWNRNALTLTIVETGDGEPKVHKVARADFERGVAIMAEKFPQQFAALMEGSADRVTGDLLVQCAIFSEEKYS